MKKVIVEVVEDGVKRTIEVNFEGETMPRELDKFITDHIGGRPKDRK